MNLNEYQTWIESRSTPRVNELGIIYATLGLAGETGEVVEKVKKLLRSGQEPSTQDVEYFKYEIGDILWYVGKFCNIIGLTIEDVLEANVEKLNKRHKNDTIEKRS